MTTPGTALLDQSYQYLRGGAPHRAMSSLFTGLRDLKRSWKAERWELFAKADALEHPLRELIHNDPMTSRSFDKPRGYAGDAVLLDYIYGIRKPDEGNRIGRAVYEYAISRAAAHAVRHRKDLLAHEIDRAADERPGEARVLSVACGHLREAELSVAAQRGWFERFVCMDADARSLEVIEDRWGDQMETIPMSIARLIGRPERLGTFDFAYSAGLYDYLEQPLATRLTSCLFQLLRPGGRLLVSNFLPSVPDVGYMETYMGWELIYRTPEELRGVADEISEEEVAGVRVFSDPFDAIVYLEVRKA